MKRWAKATRRTLVVITIISGIICIPYEHALKEVVRKQQDHAYTLVELTESRVSDVGMVEIDIAEQDDVQAEGGDGGAFGELEAGSDDFQAVEPSIQQERVFVPEPDRPQPVAQGDSHWHRLERERVALGSALVPVRWTFNISLMLFCALIPTASVVERRRMLGWFSLRDTYVRLREMAKQMWAGTYMTPRLARRLAASELVIVAFCIAGPIVSDMFDHHLWFTPIETLLDTCWIIALIAIHPLIVVAYVVNKRVDNHFEGTRNSMIISGFLYYWGVVCWLSAGFAVFVMLIAFS
jgi:hypothetical protein